MSDRFSIEGSSRGGMPGLSRSQDINFVKANQSGTAGLMNGEATGRLGCKPSLSRVVLLRGLKGGYTTQGDVVLLVAPKLPLDKTHVISHDAPIIWACSTITLQCPPRQPHHNSWCRLCAPSPQNLLGIRRPPRSSGKEQNPYSAPALRCKAGARRRYQTPIERPSGKRIFVLLACVVSRRSEEKVYCRYRPIRRKSHHVA
jgi:hypothetical protein